MGTTAFNEDGVEFFNLSLSASEGTKLENIRKLLKVIIVLTRRLASLRARLSLLFFKSSITRRS